ncbi:RBP11-like subunits of RNA polymerase [Meredithblackwellia eburnea MCA 4105]
MSHIYQGHEMSKLGPNLSNKVSILPGATDNLTAATYCIYEEDHTLGNLLRWMLMKNPDVEFCGYSAPHPSEAKIHLRIQMYDNKSSLDALHTAINNLEEMTKVIEDKYKESLASGDFDRPEELDMSFEAVNDRLWKEKEAQGRGTREEFERQKREKEEAEEKEEERLTGKKGKSIKPGK